MPERIQMSRQRPWRAEHPDAVIVARPSKWGNPYRVGDEFAWMGAYPVLGIEEPLTREDAVDLFRAAIVHGHLPCTEDDVRRELAGRDLACWCPLDQPCHADVLLELANPASPTEGNDRD